LGAALYGMGFCSREFVSRKLLAGDGAQDSWILPLGDEVGLRRLLKPEDVGRLQPADVAGRHPLECLLFGVGRELGEAEALELARAICSHRREFERGKAPVSLRKGQTKTGGEARTIQQNTRKDVYRSLMAVEVGCWFGSPVVSTSIGSCVPV